MDIYGVNSLPVEDRKEAVRRQLHGLLTSYADEADVFTEIIQNAMDSLKLAIERGYFNESDDEPTLTIGIGRAPDSHHYLYVSDNGVGMSRPTAEKLTIPGFSADKKRGKTLGYKGVGASYFFATSECISLTTVDNSKDRTEYTVRGSHNWIKNADEPEPRVETDFWHPEAVRDYVPQERGTAVCIQFHEGMKPKHLSNLVIVGDGGEAELRHWVSFLAVKTAIGSTKDQSHLGIKLKIFLDSPQGIEEQVWSLGEYDLHNLKVGYPYPHRVFGQGSTKDALEIDSTSDSQRPQHTRRYHAVRKRWTANEIIEETTTLEDTEREALAGCFKWCEGYLAYSTEVMDEINSRLGGRSRLMRYGIRLSCDGIPQGRMVDLSLTSNQGLDRQAHIVLGFEGLELDTGRKISADETIASAITKLGNRVVNVLKDYRWAMKKKDRAEVATDLSKWRQEVDGRAQGSLIKELYDHIDQPPAFRVDPDNESEVIALFVALIEQKILKGYRIQAISGYATYDSLIDVDTSHSDVTAHADSLAVKNNDIDDSGESRVLEFKFDFDSLLEDFEAKKKNPAEIDLVVCWRVPKLIIPRGRLEPTYARWKDLRPVYGCTYVWTDDNQTNRFPVIVLKNFMAEKLMALEAKKEQQDIGHATLRQLEDSDKEAMV